MRVFLTRTSGSLEHRRDIDVTSIASLASVTRIRTLSPANFCFPPVDNKKVIKIIRELVIVRFDCQNETARVHAERKIELLGFILAAGNVE